MQRIAILLARDPRIVLVHAHRRQNRSRWHHRRRQRSAGLVGDVVIQGDRIAAVGSLANANAETVVDACGLVVAPGFS